MQINSLTSSLIGGVECLQTENGTQFHAKFMVKEDELSSFLPEIGSSALWASDQAIVTRIQKTWFAQGVWVVSITAENADENDILFSFGGSRLTKYTEKNFSVIDLYCKPEWWGLRTASLADCAEFIGSGKITPGERKYYNCSGAWANPGDYIYINAKPLYFSPETGEKVQSPDAGFPDYSNSPFTEGSRHSASLIGQTLKTRLYQCAFNCTRDPGKINHFAGISGSFQNACSPGGSTDGKWKATGQYVRKIRSSSGKTYTHVVRTMIEAPDGMFWDPAKNGGYWSW